MLGAYIAVILPLCYSKDKVIVSVIFCFCITLLIALEARTAIIAVTITGLIYLLINCKIHRKLYKYILSATVIGLFVLINWYPNSVSGRLLIWLTSSAMLISKPQGWGLYGFTKHYPEFQSKFLVKHPIFAEIFNTDITHSAFNEFLSIGVQLGVVD